MASPKYNSPMISTSPLAKLASNTPGQKSDDMEVDFITKEDPLQKLHQQDIMPELFTVLHDLQVGKLLAKDFDNKLGSIRLRLGNMKQVLRDIPGITETIEDREEKIQSLQVNNQKKLELVEDFNKRIEK